MHANNMDYPMRTKSMLSLSTSNSQRQNLALQTYEKVQPDLKSNNSYKSPNVRFTKFQ